MGTVPPSLGARGERVLELDGLEGSGDSDVAKRICWPHGVMRCRERAPVGAMPPLSSDELTTLLDTPDSTIAW